MSPGNMGINMLGKHEAFYRSVGHLRWFRRRTLEGALLMRIRPGLCAALLGCSATVFCRAHAEQTP